MKSKLYFLFIASVLFVYGCSSGRNVQNDIAHLNAFESLKANINKLFNDSLFANAHWGVLIQSLNTGEIWYEQNSNKLFMPASNQKIITTAAALTKLGPEFQFETDLYYTGSIKDSILNGDLIIWSNGDPTFYENFFDEPTTVFKEWASILKAKGIKRISGNIIGDDNAFDEKQYGNGWSLDYLSDYYAAEIGALQLNENYIDLNIIPPDSLNGAVLIEPNLPSSYFTILNNLKIIPTGRSRLEVTRKFGTNNITLEGTILTGATPLQESPSISNPTLFYSHVLKEVFQNEGIKVDGCAKDCDDIIDFASISIYRQFIHKHYSPYLKNIMKELMKRSQNLYAETFARVLGWKYYGLGSFENGRKVVQEVLQQFGIKPDSYAYKDGSGLTRYNYISPSQIVKILKSMYNSPYKDVWLESFPIAGVDGTLKSRMKGTKAGGNVRAKTGTISNVRGLSGYVKTQDGEELVFSFLVNGHLRSTSDTNYITDTVLEIISEYNSQIAGK